MTRRRTEDPGREDGDIGDGEIGDGTGAMARQVEELEFAPAEPLAVVARMELLTQAADGWINFTPRVVDGVDEEEPGDPRLGFAALLGGVSPPLVPFCTWVPRPRAKGGGATLGVLHNRGRHSVELLRSAGAAVPAGWRVEQDHQRRGLILRVDAATPAPDVLGWTCLAVAVLCLPTMTGFWRVFVHLPKVDAVRE
jgi:hypothetical protein